ncbi:hypothetical protein P3F83_11385 [Mycobacteroides immunogenum]|uniref:WXG100 family type VII secretion target n=1 Tax=Mycobacteroides immunogenum TaxID=83262 RepID=UPI0025B751A0|nr:WXG100 family type VII secretion target [Mycobacteroides immunogenum]WJR35890.1 hypothetical protein P3F83_11385 [Mycobacteroides immunogenum]
MNGGLNVNSEDVKKLANTLSVTVDHFNACGNNLQAIGRGIQACFRDEAATAMASALTEFFQAWSAVVSEEQRIMEKLAEAGITFSSRDSDAAGSIAQSTNNSLNL